MLERTVAPMRLCITLVIDDSESCVSTSILTDTGRLTMVTDQNLKRQVQSDLPCIASERKSQRAQMSHAVRQIDENYFESEAL